MIAPASLHPNLVICRANMNDAGLLAEFGARTFSETFAADNSPADMAAYLASSFSEAQQTAELADPESTFHIARSNGVAVGYAMLRTGSVLDPVTDDNPIELVRLYVSREHLGRGVGAALMRVCISEASRHGHRTLWLGVWEHNHRAQSFYRKWNFHQVGTHIFQLGNDAQTDILMERSITAFDIMASHNG
jgi:ribosomal protein S18 acetylase RimI-like enzyme